MLAEFHALGTIGFGGLGPRSAGALLAQPKRVAVLTYLALAAPARGQVREHLVALFWPDVRPARGRGSLRNALHFLRRHLGADAIRSRGEEVAIEDGVLWCDALAFQSCLTERRYREALELYRGDLLPGLVLREPWGFAPWVEEERTRLRRCATEAAWAVVAQEERLANWISASEYARRAVALSGDSEQAVRRLMRLLDRAGDRVAALREYRRFTARWAAHDGLAPSPATEALAETIRSGSPVRPTAVAAPGAVTGRRPEPHRRPLQRIAALPFLIDAPRGPDEYLAAGLSHEIISSLSRLSSVQVVARTSSDRFRERGGQTVEHIARRLGVDAVLDGSLRFIGPRLVVVTRLIDGRTGHRIWAEVYECEPATLLSIRTELVLDMLGALAIEVAAGEAEYLAREPTTEPDAYLQYLRGRFQWSRRSQRSAEAAIGHFEQALSIDPRFARAQAGLADAYAMLCMAAGARAAEMRTRARAAAKAALAIDAQLGEAHATLGLMEIAAGADWLGVERAFRRAITLSPGYATAHQWYGDFLSYVMRRFVRGAGELELARQLDPLSPIIHTDIGLTWLHRGRPSEAVAALTRALEIEPDFWRAHYDLGVTGVLSGAPERGVEHLMHAWRLGAFGAGTEGGEAPRSPPRDWRAPLVRKLAELTERRRHRGMRGFEAALVSMLLDRHEEALNWLRLVDTEGSWILVAQYYPAFQPLRQRVDFVALLDRVGFGQLLTGGAHES